MPAPLVSSYMQLVCCCFSCCWVELGARTTAWFMCLSVCRVSFCCALCGLCMVAVMEHTNGMWAAACVLRCAAGGIVKWLNGKMHDVLCTLHMCAGNRLGSTARCAESKCLLLLCLPICSLCVLLFLSCCWVELGARTTAWFMCVFLCVECLSAVLCVGCAWSRN